MKLLFCIGFLLFCLSSQSEEGMWPFHQVPKDKIKQKYGVDLTDEWLEHIQKSSLRMSSGGSASFISSKGLVMTNHHVGASSIHNLSSKDHNYFEEGFYASRLDQELPCPNLYVDQLISVSDVTEEVNSNASKSLSFAEKEDFRNKVIANIQREAKEKTGLQPEVVTMYHGAKCYLYLYKRYSDIRLVMAPESSVASLGGDIDNFEYPRYSLDMCFFRVYDQGKPIQTEHYLKHSLRGPREGELLFVSGHPGKTKRMFTADHLKFSEEVEIPLVLRYLEERLQVLESFSLQGDEQKRVAKQQSHSLSNAYKVYKGLEKGFKGSMPVLQKEKKDALLRDKDLEQDPWVKLKNALNQARSYINSYFVLEGFSSNYSKLYGIAKNLVRLSVEKKLPNEKRLLEYIDTEIPKLELKILSKEPFFLDLEIACLEDSIQRISRVLGKDHPLVLNVLKGQTPLEAARKIITGTSLFKEEDRLNLYKNLEDVASSQDPLICFAKAVDFYARAVRREKEESCDSLQRECYALIAKKEFEKYGDSVYPDATFTLRLSLGQMKGYEEFSPTTNFQGLYDHVKKHNFQDPYSLLKKWDIAESKLNKKASLNFVSTHDIIGGNSGSPVFNIEGEWVGLIFDGNCYSITWSHMFDETLGRSISVHSQGIIESLEHVYRADELVKEIQGLN